MSPTVTAADYIAAGFFSLMCLSGLACLVAAALGKRVPEITMARLVDAWLLLIVITLVAAYVAARAR